MSSDGKTTSWSYWHLVITTSKNCSNSLSSKIQAIESSVSHLNESFDKDTHHMLGTTVTVIP